MDKPRWATLGVTVPSWFEPLYGPGGTNPGNDTVAQLLRPFPQYLDIGGSNNSKCSCLENLGISTYNSFQAKLERRFRNGLNLLASYTYSKTLTNADSSIPVFSGFSSNQFAAQNPFNHNHRRPLVIRIRPTRWSSATSYELPAGRGKAHFNQGVASKILGGWAVSGVLRYQSGTPTVLNTFVNSPPGTDGAFRLSVVPGVPILAPTNGSFNPTITKHDQYYPGRPPKWLQREPGRDIQPSARLYKRRRYGLKHKQFLQLRRVHRS